MERNRRGGFSDMTPFCIHLQEPNVETMGQFPAVHGPPGPQEEPNKNWHSKSYSPMIFH